MTLLSLPDENGPGEGGRPSPADEAIAWSIRLWDDPGDGEMRTAFEAWRAASPDNAEAWTAVARTMAAVDALPETGSAAAVAQDAGRRRRHVRPSSPRRPLRRLLPVGIAAAAACLVVWVAGPRLLLHWRADHRTAAGEVRVIALPDGSTVTLGADSAIEIGAFDGMRHVELLQGAALFDVRHDETRPFHVAAGDTRVDVLGTAFEVDLDDDETTVKVARGRVRVGSAGGETLAERLEPGDTIRIARDGAPILATVAPDAIGLWQDGRLVVQDESLGAAIDELRPWFAGIIVVLNPDLGTRRITGVYNLHAPLEALAAMTRPYEDVWVARMMPWVVVVGGS